MAASNTIILSSSSPNSWIVTTPPGKAGMGLSSSPLPSPSVLIRGATTGNVKAVKGKKKGLEEEVESAIAKARGGGFGGSGFDPAPLPLNKALRSGFDAIDRVEKLLEVAKKDSKQAVDVTDVVGPVKKPRAPPKAGTATGKKTATTISNKDKDDGAGEVVAPKTRKPRAPKKVTSVAEAESNETVIPEVEIVDGVIVFKKSPANPDPVKKPRKKRSSEEGQTKIKKGKIIKPHITEGQGESIQPKRKPVKRKSAETDSVNTLAENYRGPIVEADEPLGLEPATLRRRSWTPVRDCNGVTEDSESKGNGVAGEGLNEAFGIDLTADTPQTNKLERHLDSYSYAGMANADASKHSGDGESFTKRRKLDMIETTTPRNNTAKRSRSPKKKPQTITGKATAPFLCKEQSKEASLLKYFSQPASDGGHDATSRNFAELQVKKADPTVRKRKASNPKPTKPAVTLLPPDQALEATKYQDILFGTSSQLVNENSPTFIREIQEAISISESFGIPPDSGISRIVEPGSPTPSKLMRGRSSKNLWSEAARDSQGSLLEPEVIDLLDTPKVTEALTETPTADPFSEIDSVATSLMQDHGWASMNDLDMDTPQQFKEPILAGPALSEPIAVPPSEVPVLPRSLAEAALRPRSKSITKKRKASEKQITEQSVMPRYEGMTGTELAKAISVYGFKPIKNRDTMIDLLKKCWEQRQQRALQSLPADTNASDLPDPSENSNKDTAKEPSPTKKKGRAAKPKAPVDGKSAPSALVAKPRGRPKTTATASVTTDSTNQPAITDPPTTPAKPKQKKSSNRRPPRDDIEDPNPPPTPSPPRRSNTLVSPRALRLLPTTSGASDIKTDTAPTNKSMLFSKITETITTAPATIDAKNLSWHEKILLYDPIVIEELTAWLNTEGLGRVGVDEEVRVELVKEWCEAKSICCLWRDGWRGRRGKGKEVLIE